MTELLPDFRELLLAAGVLYFWYAPMLLIVTRPGLTLRQRCCWSCFCICSSWFSYLCLKKHGARLPALFSGKGE